MISIKIVMFISHDLMRDIVGYLNDTDLWYLRNVSPIIDREIRALGKCIFFVGKWAGHDFTEAGSMIIRLCSGRCVGLKKGTRGYIDVDRHKACLDGSIKVTNKLSRMTWHIIDKSSKTLFWSYGDEFVFTRYGDLKANAHKIQFIPRENKPIHDSLGYHIRPHQIDMNSKYVISSNFKCIYYESFEIICQDGRWIIENDDCRNLTTANQEK